MSRMISDHTLSQLSACIAGHMGLSFPEERWRDLERGIGAAAREFDFQDAEACAQWLLASSLTKSQVEILASHLTVGETYFFRETKSFEMLREQVLPELIRFRQPTQRRLRLWSAGCCTGEEPYSLAMLLSQMIPDLRDWKISILASDINPRFLKKASEGVYNKWSFRGTPAGVQERFFHQTAAGCFEILPRLKNMVTFAYLNLAEDGYPSLWNQTHDMDVILCRNVLMYFAPERAQSVIRNLYRSLGAGGWLIVSPSELSHTLFSSFVTVAFPGAIFYQKDSRQAQDGFPGSLPSRLIEASAAWPPPSATALTRPEASIPIDFSASLLPPAEASREMNIFPSQSQAALAPDGQGGEMEAEERVLASLPPEPDDAEALALLARTAANQGHLTEALKWCDQALAADQLSEGCHYLRAVILQEHGALEAAETSLKCALYLDPDFALAYFALGHLSLRRGRVKESLKHFANALSLLQAYRPEDLLPESEGMTAGRLAEVIRSTMASKPSV